MTSLGEEMEAEHALQIAGSGELGWWCLEDGTDLTGVSCEGGWRGLAGVGGAFFTLMGVGLGMLLREGVGLGMLLREGVGLGMLLREHIATGFSRLRVAEKIPRRPYIAS